MLDSLIGSLPLCFIISHSSSLMPKATSFPSSVETTENYSFQALHSAKFCCLIYLIYVFLIILSLPSCYFPILFQDFLLHVCLELEVRALFCIVLNLRYLLLESFPTSCFLSTSVKSRGVRNLLRSIQK